MFHVWCLAVALARPARPTLSDRIFEPRLPDVKIAQKSGVVRVPGFASEEEIAAVHAAAAEVRASAGQVARSNSLTGNAAPGSWTTVYLNAKLAELLPDFRKRLIAAVREADAEHWGVLDAMQLADDELSMRCAEYHTVHLSGGLPIQKHYDYGSLFTMDLMLADGAADFEGGAFCTLEASGTLQPHAFEQGDLLIFLSHKYHCVEPVTAGTRQVLVCELWEGLERRCNCRCDIPWGPCSCGLDSDALYVRHREGAFTDFATVPFSFKSPLAVKKAWAAMQSWKRR